MSTGGVPLIYLGDEVGQLNDYSYNNDPNKMDDSRWVHRPLYPEQRYAERNNPQTHAGQLYAGFRKLIKLRKETEELAGGRAIGFYTANPAVLGYQRPGPSTTVLCLANFSDHSQWVGRDRFISLPIEAHDLVSGYMINLHDAGIHFKPFQFIWLRYKI